MLCTCRYCNAGTFKIIPDRLNTAAQIFREKNFRYCIESQVVFRADKTMAFIREKHVSDWNGMAYRLLRSARTRPPNKRDRPMKCIVSIVGQIQKLSLTAWDNQLF